MVGSGHLTASWSGIVGMCSNVFVHLLLSHTVPPFPGALHYCRFFVAPLCTLGYVSENKLYI